MKPSELPYTSIEQCVKVIKLQEDLLEKMEETKEMLMKLCAVKDERIAVHKEMLDYIHKEMMK